MILGKEGVKYGLELRKPPNETSDRRSQDNATRKQGAHGPISKVGNVFGESSSENESDVEEMALRGRRGGGGGKSSVEQQIARQAAHKQQDAKVANMHAEALAQDALIFDYDAHYDSIQESRVASKKKEKLARESRYVAGLLEKAEERRREQEVLMERRMEKEREAEKMVYGEKEKFVTSAYRKKLEEDAKWKEDRAKKQAEEEANAVEKRGHMGDFYRNLFRNNVAFGTKAEKEIEGRSRTKQKANVVEPVEAGLHSSEDKTHDIETKHDKDSSTQKEVKKKTSDSMKEDTDKDAIIHEDMNAAVQSNRTKPDTSPIAPEKEQVDISVQPQGVTKSTDGTSTIKNVTSSSHSREQAIASARERYLARKRLKTAK